MASLVAVTEQKLREPERAFRLTGSLEDEASWLREVRRTRGGPLLRPTLRIDREKLLVHYKIAYVSPSDATRCPATRALHLLHKALAPCSPGDLVSIAAYGDRTLFFEVNLPAYDLGDRVEAGQGKGQT